MKTCDEEAPKRLLNEVRTTSGECVQKKRAYMADPIIPRKAAPMVFPSVGSTILNDEAAGHETTKPLEAKLKGYGEKKRTSQKSQGIFINFVHMMKGKMLHSWR